MPAQALGGRRRARVLHHAPAAEAARDRQAGSAGAADRPATCDPNGILKYLQCRPTSVRGNFPMF